MVKLDDPLPFKIINTNIIQSVELIYININNGKGSLSLYDFNDGTVSRINIY